MDERLTQDQPAAALQVTTDPQLQPNALFGEFGIAGDEGSEQRQHHCLHGVGWTGHDVLRVGVDARRQLWASGEQRARSQAGHPVGLGQRVDEDHRAVVPGILPEPGEEFAMPGMEPHVDRIQNHRGMGPTLQDGVDERLQLLRGQRPSGGIVHRHHVDAVDLDIVATRARSAASGSMSGRLGARKRTFIPLSAI
jgi:hypothetical protein